MKDYNPHFSFGDIFNTVKSLNLWTYIPKIGEGGEKHRFDKNYVKPISSIKLKPEEFMAMNPIDVTENIANLGGATSAVQIGSFSRSHISNTVYDEWKKELKGKNLLDKIKNHWEEIIRLSAQTQVYFDLNPKEAEKSYEKLRTETIDALSIKGKKTEIERFQKIIETELKKELDNAKVIFSRDPHYNSGALKKIGNVIENNPINALCILCALSLLETGDPEENIIIDTVFDFYTGRTTCKKQEYFEKLWEAHCKGSSKERRTEFGEQKFGCKNNKDLIDYYVFPTIRKWGNDNGNTGWGWMDAHYAFNSFNKKAKYITGAAGYGKTALMDVVLLCSIFEYLDKCNSKVANMTGAQRKKYKETKKSLFGENNTVYYPVFIHSSVVNGIDIDKSKKDKQLLTEVAEYSELIDIDSAERDGEKLLIIIDSLDEVERDQLKPYMSYISRIQKVFSGTDKVFSNADMVVSSRPIDVQIDVSFLYESLELGELNEQSVYKIIELVDNNRISYFEKEFGINSDLLKLAKNPLMLFIILDSNENQNFTFLVKDIVESIIGSRWTVIDFDYVEKDDEIEFLLGYLALRAICSHEMIFRPNEIEVYFKSAYYDYDKAGIYDGELEQAINHVKCLMRVLSIQSGILINDKEKKSFYRFQDDIIMDWLAAYCLKELIGGTCEDSVNTLEETITSLSNILHKFAGDYNGVLSENEVKMLLFCMVLLSYDNYKTFQIGILRCIYDIQERSKDENELNNIREGIKVIAEGKYGNHGIRNRDLK